MTHIYPILAKTRGFAESFTYYLPTKRRSPPIQIGKLGLHSHSGDGQNSAQWILFELRTYFSICMYVLWNIITIYILLFCLEILKVAIPEMIDADTFVVLIYFSVELSDRHGRGGAASAKRKHGL